MISPLPRILLAVSSALLLLGSLAHARAFKKAVAAVSASNLPHFYGQALQGLWLIDSATLLILAIIFGIATARPRSISWLVMILLALIPAATAAFLYYFIGMFIPAHALALTAILAASAGAMLRRTHANAARL